MPLNLEGHILVNLEKGKKLSALPLLVSLCFQHDRLEKIALENSSSFSLAIVGLPNREKQDRIIQWFEQYLRGISPPFPFDLWQGKTLFTKLVYQQLQKIPFGVTKTYSEIAQALSSPRAYRAVGNACHHNRFPLVIPCHRVLGSHGALTGFAFGLDIKQKLLDFEKSFIRPLA